MRFQKILRNSKSLCNNLNRKYAVKKSRKPFKIRLSGFLLFRYRSVCINNVSKYILDIQKISPLSHPDHHMRFWQVLPKSSECCCPTQHGNPAHQLYRGA